MGLQFLYEIGTIFNDKNSSDWPLIRSVVFLEFKR